MELCGGGTLAEALDTKQLGGTGPDALHVAAGLARGLAFLHAQSPPIIHRDLKPSNVLLDDGPQHLGPTTAKIADFGTSRFRALESTMSGGMGTPFSRRPSCCSAAGATTSRSTCGRSAASSPACSTSARCRTRPSSAPTRASSRASPPAPSAPTRPATRGCRHSCASAAGATPPSARPPPRSTAASRAARRRDGAAWLACSRCAPQALQSRSVVLRVYLSESLFQIKIARTEYNSHRDHSPAQPCPPPTLPGEVRC